MADKSEGLGLNISDDDIYQAMKEIPGYFDITPEDFRDVYLHSFNHAVERIKHSIRARDIMTEEVVSAEKETSLIEVAEMMAKKNISGVPVIEEKKVVGVISEKDFLTRMGSKGEITFMGIISECLRGKGCVAVPIRAKKAEDIMSTPPVTVNEDTTLMDITGLFHQKKINRVPVIDKNGALVGIVTRGDVVRVSTFKYND